MTRTWRMFAGRPTRVFAGREFHGFGDERYVRFRGQEPTPVVLTEDPDGVYWGWLRTGADKPEMVQSHEGMFRMQSPDGFVDKVARGDGEIVRMSCRVDNR